MRYDMICGKLSDAICTEERRKCESGRVIPMQRRHEDVIQQKRLTDGI
jgi:hypothetical protein